MDRDLLHELVRFKLKDNRLPRSGAVGIRETGRLSSNGRRCNACDHGISPNQKAVLVMVSLERMSVFFHADCYEVWDAERLALADQDRDIQGGSVTTESL
jgi:hypothetical protein